MTSQWVMTLLGMPQSEIAIGNDVAREINCDITISKDIAICSYHCLIMHNGVAMNHVHYVFSDLCLIVLFYCR